MVGWRWKSRSATLRLERRGAVVVAVPDVELPHPVRGPGASDARTGPPVKAVDTSVVIAAFATWHESHARALSSRCGAALRCRRPCALEMYAVLTRLPAPHRVAPEVVRDYLAATFPGRPADPARRRRRAGWWRRSSSAASPVAPHTTRSSDSSPDRLAPRS